MASQEQAVEQLFGAALDRRPEDRRAFLDRECAGAPEVRQRVEELLLADEQAGHFLERKSKIFAHQSDLTQSAVESMGGPAKIRGAAPLPTGRFQPGQTIADRFEVVRFIDRGGMGEVYEVEDRFLQGVHVALKVILPHIADDAESAHRFKREVLLARKVTHPNLCPIYDIAHCELPPPPFLFLTMKLLSGETLASRLTKTEPLSRNEIISIFRQMVAGVATMHAAGVVHGDVKPKNVMLEQSESGLCLSIMDFGLARLYASEATVFTRKHIAGTPGYIAPELLGGNPPSQATDIFALGVLLQQVLTNEKPNVEADGLSAKPSAALEAVDAPPILIHAVREFLSHDPLRRCHAFEQIQPAFEAGGDLESRKLVVSSGDSQRGVLNRRNFIVGSSVAACGAAVGVIWNWDGLANRANELLHPLPQKRFVALLNWPASDPVIKPIVEGVIDAIGSELARVEAFDHDLLVVSPASDPHLKTKTQLNDVRETLGANLIFAASAVPHGKYLRLALAVVDPSSGQTLRERTIRWPLAEPIALPDKAVRAAAQLLNVERYQRNLSDAIPDTQSSTAYAAFQTAESYMKQENDAGLNAAIDKYKESVELDPHYATAYAKLANAYLRFYFIHRDSAALNLARGNADTALSLNPNLVDGHMARSLLLDQTGDKDGAGLEIERALAADPNNPRVLVAKGQLLTGLNRWPDAEEVFARVVKLRPNYWLGHEERGVLFGMEGKYSQAATEFRTASLAAPKRTLPLNNLGAVYLQQGKIEQAKIYLNRCLDLGPNDSAEKSMAATLRCEGKPIEAIPFGLRAVKLNPADGGNWLELGDCYSLARGHHAAALKAYNQAATAQDEELVDAPQDGPGWMLLALSRVKTGVLENAADLVAKAEKYFARDIDSQLYKARTLELLGKRDEALATVDACLKRGATEFQFRTLPDMGELRNDPRYHQMIGSMASTTET
ncbi:MAG TPA: protein kinase [Acidobacteriaceae bacterium]|nr:protein kinase [Acidobacteriaceae bacterium]